MRARALLVAAFAGGLVLAACGSDGNDAAEPATTAPASTAAPTTAAPATTAGPTTTAAPATTTTKPEPTTTTVATPATVLDVIRKDPELSQLGIALTSAGLTDELQAAGPFTVFAPTNTAFKALGLDKLNELNRDPAAATPVLLYHVVPGTVLSKDIAPGKVKTLSGAELEITVDGGTVKVNGIPVSIVDLVAGNGVVHVIDGVLLPPS